MNMKEFEPPWKGACAPGAPLDLPMQFIPSEKISIELHRESMFIPLNLYVWLAAKRSAGVAPEANLRKRVTRTPPPNANKAHSGFETLRRHHQKYKTGISVATQKGLSSSKN